MKRNEMIKVIEQVLGRDCPYLADDILIAVEEAGMLPPSIFTGNHITHNDGSESNEYLNEWEPEDEKK